MLSEWYASRKSVSSKSNLLRKDAATTAFLHVVHNTLRRVTNAGGGAREDAVGPSPIEPLPEPAAETAGGSAKDEVVIAPVTTAPAVTTRVDRLDYVVYKAFHINVDGQNYGIPILLMGSLDAETLAGVLLDAIGSKDTSAKEAWRAKGAAFFQRRGRKGGGAAAIDGSGAQAEPGGDAAGGSGSAANG